MPTRVARPARSLAAVVAPAAATLTILLASTPASAQTAVRYVALGDSYSSGVGAGSYTSSSGSCDRSTKAYPELWADASDPASYVSVACAGATTSTVISSQLRALSSSTTLISITVGGNDVGFSSVMQTCVLESTSSCVRAVGAAEAKIAGTLPGALNAVFGDIAADAPNARVVVLGYPDLYDLAKSAGCIGLSTTDRTDLNAAAGELDGQISAAAARYGDIYVSVQRYFAGHEICDSSRWLHSVNLLDIDESYHPTATGQAEGYEPALAGGVSKS